MYCEQCGRQIDPNVQNCPYCGAKNLDDDGTTLLEQSGSRQSGTDYQAYHQSRGGAEPRQSGYPGAQQGGYTAPRPDAGGYNAQPAQYSYNPAPSRPAYNPTPAPTGYSPAPARNAYSPVPPLNSYNSYGGTSPRATGGNTKVLDAVRRHAGSPVFLIAAIAVSVGLVCSLISSLLGSSALLNLGWLTSISPNVDLSDLAQIQYAAGPAAIAVAFVGSIPTILIVIGLWLTYGAAKGRGDTMSTAGLSMVKGVCIFELVMLCIGFGLVLIGMTIGLIAGAGASRNDDFMRAFGSVYSAGMGIVLVVYLLLVGLFVLLILYFAKIFATINTVKTTIRTKKPSDQVSGFVAVLNFIAVAFQLIGLIANFAVSSGLRYYVGVSSPALIINIVSTTCSIAAFILFGVLIFQYRGTMRQLQTEVR